MNSKLATQYQRSLNLRTLFDNRDDLEKCLKKLSAFSKTDQNITIHDLELTCPTQSWYMQGDGTPVIILASHPTRQSLNDHFFFSEENGRIHRFWKVFSQLKIIDFNLSPNLETEMDKQLILDRFAEHSNSKYTLNFDCFFNIPCDSVASLENIFSKTGFHKLCLIERDNFLKRLKSQIKGKPIIITFQKDVFNTMSNKNIIYSQKSAFSGNLIFENLDYLLIGLPAMRWMYSGNYKNTLLKIFSSLKN